MQPSGVIITDLRDGENGLEVQFYVQEMSGSCNSCHFSFTGDTAYDVCSLIN